MADANDVVQTARNAFEDAHRNIDCDLAAATTAVQARVVQDNHDACLANYMEALRTAFECDSADWQQALSDARKAQRAVDDARAAAEKLVDRLSGMTSLTEAVSRLIEAAK